MMKRISVIAVIILISANSLYISAAEQTAKTEDQELIEAAAPAEVTAAISPLSAEKSEFEIASDSVYKNLQDSIDELNLLREQIKDEKIPLTRKLNKLESELSDVRLEYQNTTRLLDSRTLDLSNLRSEIKSREQEAAYLSNLLGEYIRNFESRLHISEIQRYRQPLERAKLAPENTSLSEKEIYRAQADVLSLTLERLEEAIGGSRFRGTAADGNGKLYQGRFILIGSSAIFKSDDGNVIGNVEQRLGSLEPSIIPYGNPADTDAASKVLSTSSGFYPIDPTGGNAHKIEETKESLIEHIKKGGPVMYPIFAMAGAAFLVALLKWISLSLTKKPGKKQIKALLKAVEAYDTKAMNKSVSIIKGPVGQMLKSGVEHINEPRELIEEVMYEKVLATRLKLERFLPFIAISAASAPLLGLLGTVTGIINTFKLLTVFGSGDVKALSGGISEALVTTEFGLIVAIPSLLIHAFLSRKAKGMINEMEKSAVAFINQVSKNPHHKEVEANPFAGLTPEQLKGLFAGGNAVTVQEQEDTSEEEPEIPMQSYEEGTAGALMDINILKVGKNSNVSDAIDEIRNAKLQNDIDSVYVVDDQGVFYGNVLLRHLLIRSEDDIVGPISENSSVFVRHNTPKAEIDSLLHKHGINRIPVLDDEGQLIGQIFDNGNGDGK